MRLKVSLIVGAAFAASFAVGLLAAPSRVATLPPYDPSADAGKVAAISPSGNVAWSTASAITGAVVGPASAVNNDLAAFDGITGKLIKDSGVLTANVVLVSRAVQAGTGLTVTNSGLLSADITMSLTSPVSITLGGTSGSTAASGFANLSPLTTKGDLIGYSTAPTRLAVGTTGAVLQSDSTSSSGVSWLPSSYVEWAKGAAQAVTGATWTPVNWGTSTPADPAANITLASNASGPTGTRITVANAGIYQFTGNVTFASNGTGLRYVLLEKNVNGTNSSAAGTGFVVVNAVASDTTSIPISSLIKLAASDYIEVFVFQGSGGALNLDASVGTGTRVQVRRVSSF